MFLGTQAFKGLLVGGGLKDDNAEVYKAFINISTYANGYQYIGIITGASDASVAQENGLAYVELFKNYSATKVEWLPIDANHTSNANSTTLAAKIALMTGIFFGGGDQERLKSIMMYQKNGVWYDSLTLAAIRTKVLTDQLAIGGSSAGTDIQQMTPMITGGLSYLALRWGPFVYNSKNMDSDLLTYDPTGGFGLYNYPVFLDTHVGTRGRQGRDVVLIYKLLQNGTLGIGLDENTGIIIDDDAFTVVGVNGIYIYDLSIARNVSSRSSYFNVENVLVSYLTDGDSYNITSRTASFPSWKSNIDGKQIHSRPKTTYDIFSAYNNKSGEVTHPEEFTNITTYFFDSKISGADSYRTWGETYEENPIFDVDFDKTYAVGYYYEDADTTLISYYNMSMSIEVYAGEGRDRNAGLEENYEEIDY